MTTLLDQFLRPDVFVVALRRGYAHESMVPVLRREMTAVFADPADPLYDVRYANYLDKWYLENRPSNKVRVFIRDEDWQRIKHFPAVRHLASRTWTMPRPWLEGKPDPSVADAWGNHPLEKAEVKRWVSRQPESEFLLVALPGRQDVNRTHLSRLRSNLLAARLRDDEMEKRWVWDSIPAFLDHCELIGVGRRIKDQRWEWAPLWLYGLREMDKENV